MTRLVLVNGAPGSGKSTVATRLARLAPLSLALDIDQVKHSLGRWDDDPLAAGLVARRLAIAMVKQHLVDGHDVFLGQYLARTDFIDELSRLAHQAGASFHEFLLVVDADELARRLQQRQARPTRPEHQVNNQLVQPSDAPGLVASLADLSRTRPDAVGIAANGRLDEVVAEISGRLGIG